VAVRLKDACIYGREGECKRKNWRHRSGDAQQKEKGQHPPGRPIKKGGAVEGGASGQVAGDVVSCEERVLERGILKRIANLRDLNWDIKKDRASVSRSNPTVPQTKGSL